MNLDFTKMQGLGNDFVVFDAIHQNINLSPAHIRQLADRHFGIGCDQVLLVEEAKGTQADFRYRIFNADGSEVEQCGNGARCFARFVREQGLTDKTEIPVLTASGLIVLKIEADNQVTVDMGEPILEPKRLPFTAMQQQIIYHLELAHYGQTIEFSAVSMGNPHAVIRVEDVDKADVSGMGAELESHSAFPQRVNVGFMQYINAEHIRLRVYERGAGETLACGTGACAAVVAGRLQGLLATQVNVDLPGGQLNIHWEGTGTAVMMTGPATTVFTGTVTL